MRLPAPGAQTPRPGSAAPEAPRILACAQSNAAIDELLARLAERGIFSAQAGTRRCRAPPWAFCLPVVGMRACSGLSIAGCHGCGQPIQEIGHLASLV